MDFKNLNLTSDKIKQLINRVSFTIIAILSPILLIYIGSSRMNTPNLYSMVQLEDGWTICRDGETKENVTLSEASIGIMNDNDVISISRVLPEVNSPSPCLSFRSLLSTIKVYINDELYYTYGQDFREKGDMLPKAYHYIPIDKIEENMTITIEYTATEDNAFSGLGEFYIGDRTDIENMYIQTKRMPFFISVFLIMFSFILIILTPALFSTGYKNPGIIFNALISYCLGSYILCYNDIIFFFTDYYFFGTILEYISLFMVPFSTMGYLLFTGKQFDTVVTRTMMIVDTIFVFVVSVLHFTNIRHFNHYVIYMHVISLIEGIYIIYSLIKFIIASKRNDTENISLVSSYFLAYGLIFLVICAIIDIFKFNFEKLLGSSGDLSSTISFITLGALAFVLTLLLSYLFHCIEYIGSNRIKQHLVGLAYTDELTGLSNRAKCEQTLVSLNKQNENYYIISLDLDNLKPVNDNFGHLEGDHLIMDFAEILKNSFENAHLLGRMGGDEFIVVIFSDNNNILDECISKLKVAIATKNNDGTSKHYRISCSWGYASINEEGVENSNDVYMLADSRMYIMKNEHHKKTLDRIYSDIGNVLIGGADNEK